MVKVHDDFWQNYTENEELIKKSTIDITLKQFKWPGDNEHKEVLNHVISEMHRLCIFQKWNSKRLTSKTRTERQQFENFIYQRIWAILYGAYNKRRNQKIREKHHPFFEEKIHPKAWKTSDMLYNDEDDIENIKENKKTKEKELREYRAKKAPLIVHIRTEQTDDLATVNSTYEAILNACKNQKEKDIIQARKEGIDIADIAQNQGVKPLYVSNILKDIKKRFSRNQKAFA